MQLLKPGRRNCGADKLLAFCLTQLTELQVNKHDIIRELSLASRDLITVDQEVLNDTYAASQSWQVHCSYPVSEQVPIAYPSGLLVRERALIVNLDSIRLIAGRDQVQ